MRARTVVVLGLVCLVALAGCNALNPGGDGEPPNGFDYPAGANADGISNASAVLQGHHDAIAADSYRVAFNATYITPQSFGNSTWIVGSNATQRRQLLNATIEGQQRDQYLNGDQMYSRLIVENQTDYGVQQLSGSIDGLHRSEAQPGPLLETVVSTGNYTVNRTETVDGRDLVTYDTTSPRANASGQVPDDIERYNATLQLDEDGRIWSAELFASGESNGTQEIYFQEYRTLSVGDVTISRPAWVDDAANDANASRQRLSSP